MEEDGGIIVLMEERMNSTYKWVMLIVATIAQTTATLITYGVGVFALFWKEEYALKNMESGLLVSVVNVGPLFCMLLSVGYLIDIMKNINFYQFIFAREFAFTD